MAFRHLQYTSRLEDRHLRRVGMGLAVVLWLGLATAHWVVSSQTFTLAEALLDLAILLFGAAAFGTWTMHRLAQREAQIRHHVDQLEALHGAALALTAELDLGAVLQTVVDQSRRLVNARYGALGVLAEDGRFLEQFITSGLSAEQRARIGHPPQGDGLLGVPIREGRPLRVPEIASDTRFSGFPAHHPSMHSLLAVPIIAKGKIIGIPYLADKIETGEQGQTLRAVFSEQDEALLVMFARRPLPSRTPVSTASTSDWPSIRNGNGLAETCTTVPSNPSMPLASCWRMANTASRASHRRLTNGWARPSMN